MQEEGGFRPGSSVLRFYCSCSRCTVCHARRVYGGGGQLCAKRGGARSRLLASTPGLGSPCRSLTPAGSLCTPAHQPQLAAPQREFPRTFPIRTPQALDQPRAGVPRLLCTPAHQPWLTHTLEPRFPGPSRQRCHVHTPCTPYSICV